MQIESYDQVIDSQDPIHKYASYIPKDIEEYFVNFQFESVDLIHPGLHLVKSISNIAFMKSDIVYRYE
jgi:hypothetical protein